MRSKQKDGKDIPVTAVAFAPMKATERNGDKDDGDARNVLGCLLAVGTETGLVEFWIVPDDDDGGNPTADNPSRSPSCVGQVGATDCHAGAITKLAWRPTSERRQQPIHNDNNDDGGKNGTESLLLASTSADHGCRIFRVECS